MKLKEDSSVQKLRGAYYTPLPLAEMMVKLFASRMDCKNVLEPSCGDGVFLDALIKSDCIKRYASIDAVEIDGVEAKKVEGRMKAYKNVKVIRIVELNNLWDLKSFDINANGFQKLQHVHEKWTKYFTNVEENTLVKQIREDKRFQKLSDIALINVGITTGNNKYFSVERKTVEKYQMQDVVRPLIGRSSHANSIYFKHEDWMQNVNKNKAAYLIDFPDVEYKHYPKKHKEYIKMGERNGENNGITLVCSQYESTTRTGKNNTTKVTIEDPQIINGGQTAFTLAKILDNADDELVNKLKAKKVLLKVISIYQEEGKNKEYRDFVNKISDATNRQTKIDEADRRANQSVQINLQTDIFEKFGYFYERKAGEFEEALSKKIIENDMIIKRDIMLKVIWAYHGKCGEARNNSGDKIFKKDVFDSIMESGISAERAVYSYLIHKKILCLEKLHKKNDYNSAEWGNAIRYGKFAVLSAYVAQYRDEEWSEENITQRLMELLSQWKAFESFVKTKESNKKYFSDVEEFDNYYKSVNVNSDVQEYFGV